MHKLFIEAREYISRRISKGILRHDLKNLTFLDKQTKEEFLTMQALAYDWEEMSVLEWENLVDEEYDAEAESVPIKKGTIVSAQERNGLCLPPSGKSQWHYFKKDLRENKGFDERTIREIEEDTIRILSRISNDTRKREPVKGLVVGSVQSGKTTSMAALMAMASSYSWNYFIILSGTIDNLRKQTQDRLIMDMTSTGRGVSWTVVDNPSLKMESHMLPQNLDFTETMGRKYITVLLKQKNRLQDLLKWMTSDGNAMKDMRILLIDDEADQASVNTVDLDSGRDRKAINNLIVNIVNGKDAKGTDIQAKFNAMNYLAYTATPYANILSEGPSEALYPQDFISLLTTSRQHFGPAAIFGIEETEHAGLDIIRTISEEDRVQIGSIEKDIDDKLPNSLKEAVAYYLSACAALRVQNYRKPLSMLVHTSINVKHHDKIANAIADWIRISPKELLSIAEDVWEKESDRFTIGDFKASMPTYTLDPSKTYKKLPFNEIVGEFLEIIHQISPISVDDSAILYHNGVHLCIDNSQNNKINENNEYFRLIYPDNKTLDTMEKAPIFLIVGGSTMSRGLTIEGLITTYFSRNTGAADTLMQMGRWFGYRPRIELFPRIWLTSKGIRQFQFLATLDMDLRNELIEMAKQDIDYSKVGPKLLATPKYTYLTLTARNKMNDRVPVEYDFSGQNIQTYKFHDDTEIMKSNIALTESFLDSLGDAKIAKGHPGESFYWNNVPTENVSDFLRSFKAVDKMRAFRDIEAFLEWVEIAKSKDLLHNWNVIIGTIKGKDNHVNSDKIWGINNFRAHKVERSRKIELDEGIIDIGVLRNSRDLFRDIDLSEVSDEIREKIKVENSKSYSEIRNELGLEKIPQLIIYRIDKNSVGSSANGKVPLNLEEDLIGLVISIPGSKVAKATTKFTVNMKGDDLFVEEEEDLD